MSLFSFTRLDGAVLEYGGVHVGPGLGGRGGRFGVGRGGGLALVVGDGVRIKTLIDIDSRRFDKAVAEVKERQEIAPGIVFGDFRGALDDKDIDARVVGTPDHWHAIPAILGCQAGKHIYVEKPDAHNRRHSRQF
jgi:predicted dehydrogenase